MTAPQERDDDFQRRFQELVRAEFDETPSAPAAEPAEKPVREPARLREPFSFDQLWDEVKPDPADDPAEYREVTVREHSFSPLTLLGFMLLLGGLVATLAHMFGLQLPSPWPAVAGTAVVAGLAVLVWQAMHVRREVEGDGAQV